MHEEVIVLRNVYKRFWFTEALRNISLSISKGEHTLLLGGNGSGKSTLIKIIAGLIRPSKGFVNVLGRNPFKYFMLGKELNVLLDDYALPPWDTGLEYLRYVAKVRGIKWDDVISIAQTFNVTNYWRKLIGTYSAGMKKRVAVIEVLIGNPEIIILDDPFTALDKSSRNTLIKILEKKAKEVTIVVATHILHGIEKVCKSKAVLLDNGEKILEGKTTDVLNKIKFSPS